MPRAGSARAASSRRVTLTYVIRLRQSLDSTLRQPIVGPLLLVLLCVVVAFVLVHAVEHGVVGELFTCGMLAAFALRLIEALNRRQTDARQPASPSGRAPPVGRPPNARSTRVTTFLFASPLRR